MFYTDPMPAVKWWAQHEATIAAVNGDRVFFQTPEGYEDDNVPQTWLVLALVGGGPEPGDVPLDGPLVQFDCYGRTGAKAGQLLAAVRSATASLDRPVNAGGSVILAGDVGDAVWEPDPDSTRPRYTVTVRFLMVAADQEV